MKAKITRRQLVADNRQMTAVIGILAWLHAEQAHIAAEQTKALATVRAEYVRASGVAEAAQITIATLEKSEAKWRTLAQTTIDQPPATRAVLIDGHGLWSLRALSVALDEFDRCRDIARRVTEARDSIRRLTNDSHFIGMCHPIYEQAVRLLDSLLTDAVPPRHLHTSTDRTKP